MSFFKSYESILLNFVTLLIVAEGTRLLREKRGQGRPRRSLRRGGSRTARGNILTLVVQTKATVCATIFLVEVK